MGAAVPDETPNADTLEAFAELDNGGGHRFNGTTEQLFSSFHKRQTRNKSGEYLC